MKKPEVERVVFLDLMEQLRDEKKISADETIFLDIIEFSDNMENSINDYFIDSLEYQTDDMPAVRIRKTTFGYMNTKGIIALIKSLNEDPECYGIIVVGPYPDYVDKEAIQKAIKPNKNVMFETDYYLDSYKTGEGDKELRNIIPHDPVSYAVICSIDEMLDQVFLSEMDDFHDRIMKYNEEERPFRKVAVYGDKENIHCKYLAISLMKRGVSNLVFVNDDNKEELKDSSLVILMTNKKHCIKLEEINEDAYVFDATYVEYEQFNFDESYSVIYGALDESSSDKDGCKYFKGYWNPMIQFDSMIYHILVNTICSYSYEKCEIEEHGKTGVLK